MLTSRGICYDLNESKYSFKYDNLEFIFSSKFYLNKFKTTYITYLKNEIVKIQSKYQCVFYGDEMILLKLYKQIEKRGFLVRYKGELISENYFINAVVDIDNSRK